MEEKTAERKFLHDIATPLSVIIFQLETVLEDPEIQDRTARIEKALEQVRLIVTKLEARRAVVKKS